MIEIKVKSILLVSYYCPTKAHAGGLRILDIYALIKEKHQDVRVDLLTYSRPEIDWDVKIINEIFDNIYYSDQERLLPKTIEQARGRFARYDLIDLQFHQAGLEARAFRSIGDKVIYTPMESMVKVAHYDSIEIKNNITHNRNQWNLSIYERAVEELEIINNTDLTVCVSKSDAALLRAITRLTKVKFLDTCLSGFEFDKVVDGSFKFLTAGKRRCNVLYIAYFGSQTNVDALDWYISKVHPIVKEAVPDYTFTVVGRGDLSKYQGMKDKSIEFVGAVDLLSPYIKSARVGIAPALSGGGFRGKINQYAILGVPTVATKIAATGLKYENMNSIFITDDNVEFAGHCIRLLKDWGLNEKIGLSARDLSIKNYTWNAKWHKIKKIYGLENEKLVKTPLVTVIIPSYNHSKYIKKRIQSIFAQTYQKFELIVVDDCSQDDSSEVLQDLKEIYNFKLILNKSNSGSPFSAWERVSELANGKYVWICESDDVAEPDFLMTAILSLNSNPDTVLFYSHSKIIDARDNILGDTKKYFHDTFKSARWDDSFVSDGFYDLENYQLYGQTVPNMSSAVVETKAFINSYIRSMKKLKLTGDWYFIAAVMMHGKVVFSNKLLSNFRQHQVTARVRVKSAKSQAEYIIVKMLMNKLINGGEFSNRMIEVFKNDLIRFIFEPATWLDVCRNLSDLSLTEEIDFFNGLINSIKGDESLLVELSDLYRHSLTLPIK